MIFFCLQTWLISFDPIATKAIAENWKFKFQRYRTSHRHSVQNKFKWHILWKNSNLIQWLESVRYHIKQFIVFNINLLNKIRVQLHGPLSEHISRV